MQTLSAPLLKLRPYQEDAVAAVHASMIEFDRALIVMSTGSGKTLLFAKLAMDCINRRGAFCTATGNVLVLVNREELLQQARDKIQRVTGIYASIERAEDSGSLEAPIVIATIQSLQKRLDRYPSNWASLVICDEAHLFVAPKIVTVIDYFCHPDGAKLLGFTATPQTKGKRALSKVYETIAFEKGMTELINEGFLCNVKVRTVPIKIDLSAVRSIGGDFMDDDLDGVVTPYFNEIAKAMQKYGPERKWLCFLPLIRTSEVFCDVLNSNGIAAQHVDGTSYDRREILLAFQDGKFRALTQSLLLTTGYDEPSITGIVNLRPTQSTIMLTQILGRGTRLKPAGSPHDDVLVLDFLWQHDDIDKIISPAALVAASDEDEKELKKRLRSGEDVDLTMMHRAVVKDRHEKLAEALKANESKASKFLDFAALVRLGIEANPLFNGVVDYESTMAWHKKKMTPGQEQALIKMGVDIRVIKDQGHAAAMMRFCVDRIERGLCSFKQANFLIKSGRNIDPNKLSLHEASQMIGRMINK